MKKCVILAIVLFLTSMVLTSFLGCTPATNTAVSTSGNTTVTSAAATTAATTQEQQSTTASTAEKEAVQSETDTGSEPVEMRKLSVICRAIFNQYWDLKDRHKNLCYQVFEKDLADLGIEIEYDLVDDASIADVVRTRMAAQVDLPDMIADAWIGVTETEALNWAQNGLIINLKDAIETYDTDRSIYNFYETKCPGVLASVTAADGGIYWFSYLNSPTYVDDEGNLLTNFKGAPYSSSIREDWLKNAGLEYSIYMTHEELYESLLKIQEADANGNGAADEVMAIDISGFSNGIARSFGLSMQLLAAINFENNTVYNNFYLPEFHDYINYMRRLYDAGLYDTTALGEGMVTQLIADNKASLTFHYSVWSSYEATISGAENPVYAPILLVNEDDKQTGEFNLVGDPLFGSYCRYMVTSACQDLEAVIDLYKYIYTDEYAVLDRMGIEGYSFEYDEKGIPQKLYEDSANMEGWDGIPLFNTVGMIAFPSINTGYIVNDRKVRDDFTKLKGEFSNFYIDNAPSKGRVETYGSLFLFLALPTIEEMERTNEIENVLTTYANELLTDLILGNRSLSDLQSYVDEMEKLGLNDYLNIIKARRERYVEATGV